jgi:pyridoxine kinase
MRTPAVLSIQSHVAFGYVGNKAAAFLLQRLGCEVIAINTVQFSNHTGYEDFSGDVLSREHLSKILEGVERRGVFENLDAILSGYQGDVSLGELILSSVKKIKNINKKMIYLCDPVIGDIGVGRFVKAAVAEFIRDKCLPCADILTPNLFELAYLTGCEVSDFKKISDVQLACENLHQKGPSMILVTSLEGLECLGDKANLPSIHMFLSSVSNKWHREKVSYLVQTPKFELNWLPSGSGDSTAAIFLANLLKYGDPKSALEKTAGAMFEIFKATFSANTRELQLIGAQELIVNPSEQFEAIKY